MKPSRFAFALVLVALAAPAYAADVPITPDARAHFVAGVNLLKDPDGARYEEAYREFKAAYTASPSFKILGNLGLCAMKLEHDGEAIDAYEKYLAQAGKDLDPSEKKQIETDLATLRAGVFRVSITSNAANTVISDTRVSNRGDRLLNLYPMSSDKLDVGIRSGHHTIVAKAAGFDDQTWEVDASPGGKDTHAFTFKKAGGDVPVPPPTASSANVPPPPPSGSSTGSPMPPPSTETQRPVPTGAYIGAAVTGALVIGGTITGVLALGKHSDFNKKNDGTDPSAAQSLHDSGKTLSLVTDIMFGGAVVAAAVTTYLYVSRPEQPAQTGGRFFIAPSASPSGAGLIAVGSFLVGRPRARHPKARRSRRAPGDESSFAFDRRAGAIGVD